MRKLMTAMGLALAAGIMLFPGNGSTGTAAGRARALHVATSLDDTPTTTVEMPVIEETTTTTTPIPAPVVRPAATIKPIPTPAPAEPAPIIGAHVDGKDNAPLVPGHWTCNAEVTCLRDPSPGIEAYPTIGANDPAYEAQLNAELCAAKPWNC